ncbi:MAG TPA: hypothetical protein DHV36_18765 [Desulfobacteraceae bacterium]|nr:hypothetical protein [Desulfobacteraceae bacterium]
MKVTQPWSGPFGLADTTGITGLPLSGTATLKNRVTEKRWCYLGIVSPELFFGAAVIHLGYITSAFSFCFDRERRIMTEANFVRPPMGRVRYDRHSASGICRFKEGKRRIEFSGDLDTNGRQARIELDTADLLADIRLAETAGTFSPMHFPMDMGQGKAAFTTKAAGIPARGQIRAAGRTFILDPEQTFALYDWTHGAYHRKTFWNWTCGAGFASDPETGDKKTKVGFNLSRGVYENGTLENTLWVNGQPEPVAAVDYDYDTAQPLTPWKITSKDRKINLRFFPEGKRSANDNFGLVASRFIQPCGRFDGQIRTDAGHSLTLTDTAGVVEEHFAKW